LFIISFSLSFVNINGPKVSIAKTVMVKW